MSSEAAIRYSAIMFMVSAMLGGGTVSLRLDFLAFLGKLNPYPDSGRGDSQEVKPKNKIHLQSSICLSVCNCKMFITSKETWYLYFQSGLLFRLCIIS